MSPAISTVDLAADLYLLVAALGLALSVSYAGMPILGQGAFVAVGAFGVAGLGPGGAGLPLGLAGLLAVALAGLLGYAVGFGAARLQGAFLGLATWALAWLVYAVLVAFPGLSGGSQGLVRPSPAVLVSPSLGLRWQLTPAWHVLLAGLLAALALVGLLRLQRGPGGLDLAALRAGPAVAESLGLPVAARRRSTLAATAALGGVAGAGTAVLLGVTAPVDYAPLLSVQLFVAALVGGTARWWGPVLGVALLAALPHVADRLAQAGSIEPARARGASTAVLLLVVLLARKPASRLVARASAALLPGRSRPGRAAAMAAPLAVPTTRAGRQGRGEELLQARGLAVSYGPLRVLDGVDLTLRAGEVHALVGPNGSGKTTLLRVLAGALPGAGGVVRVAGRPSRQGRPERRVREGVVRTFQRTAVPEGLAPRRQVELGARGGGGAPYAVLRHLLAAPSAAAERRLRERMVAFALAETDLTGRLGERASALPAGELRLLQVARAVATGARVLLLDEPAAGMSAAERARLAGVLRRLAGGGAAVLLVEHDMGLVGRVADRVTVLAGGRVIASGSPAEVRADPGVRRVYLGTPAEETA